MQRLQTLCGGYPFTKHLRLQHRHWRQQNKQCKIHGKLFWSGVCIGIQSGDSLEQPTLHKPAGLNIAQEHSMEWNAEAARPPLWQGTSLVQGLCKVHHDFWDSLTETVLYKENLGRYRVTHLLTSAIYLLGTPQCPQIPYPLSCHVPKHFIFVTWGPGASESNLYYISPPRQDSSAKWRWGGAKGAEAFYCICHGDWCSDSITLTPFLLFLNTALGCLLP